MARSREYKKIAAFVVLSVIFFGAGFLMHAALRRDAGEADVSPLSLVAAGAKQSQQIAYLKCGHEVIRRVEVPLEWVGMTKDAVQSALPAEQRLLSFSHSLLEIIVRLDIFCPDHVVLMLDGDGTYGIYQNTYGFEMERVADAEAPPPHENARQQLSDGVGFATRDELQEWLEERGGESPPAAQGFHP